MNVMSFLIWIVVGGMAGWMASLIVHSVTDLIDNIMVGIVGGLIGGLFFHTLAEPGLNGVSVWSVCVAFIGALLLLALIRALNGSHVTV